MDITFGDLSRKERGRSCPILGSCPRSLDSTLEDISLDSRYIQSRNSRQPSAANASSRSSSRSRTSKKAHFGSPDFLRVIRTLMWFFSNSSGARREGRPPSAPRRRGRGHPGRRSDLDRSEHAFCSSVKEELRRIKREQQAQAGFATQEEFIAFKEEERKKRLENLRSPKEGLGMYRSASCQRSLGNSSELSATLEEPPPRPTSMSAPNICNVDCGFPSPQSCAHQANKLGWSEDLDEQAKDQNSPICIGHET